MLQQLGDIFRGEVAVDAGECSCIGLVDVGLGEGLALVWAVVDLVRAAATDD
jgi:hypothetical protein